MKSIGCISGYNKKLKICFIYGSLLTGFVEIMFFLEVLSKSIQWSTGLKLVNLLKVTLSVELIVSE